MQRRWQYRPVISIVECGDGLLLGFLEIGPAQVDQSGQGYGHLVGGKGRFIPYAAKDLPDIWI